MGSGTSRGTRVAPAGLGAEAKPAKKASSSAKRDAFDALRSLASRRAPVDCHSAGNDSDLSGDEDEDADTEIADDEEGRAAVRRRCKKNPAPSKKVFTRSRTYGLCHFSRGEEDEQPRGASRSSSCSSSGNGGAEGPQGSRGAGSNKTDHDAPEPPLNCFTETILTTGPTETDVAFPQTHPTSDHNTPLTTPVLLYDGSEEELMDTIEREFS
ncbi:uncharacterized protein LOC144090125 [Stigmatopora argus]